MATTTAIDWDDPFWGDLDRENLRHEHATECLALLRSAGLPVGEVVPWSQELVREVLTALDTCACKGLEPLDDPELDQPGWRCDEAYARLAGSNPRILDVGLVLAADDARNASCLAEFLAPEPDRPRPDGTARDVLRWVASSKDTRPAAELLDALRDVEGQVDGDDLVLVHALRADVFEKEGRADDALHELRLALAACSTDPGEREIHFLRIARIAHAAGNHPNAVDALGNALRELRAITDLPRDESGDFVVGDLQGTKYMDGLFASDLPRVIDWIHRLEADGADPDRLAVLKAEVREIRRRLPRL